MLSLNGIPLTRDDLTKHTRRRHLVSWTRTTSAHVSASAAAHTASTAHAPGVSSPVPAAGRPVALGPGSCCGVHHAPGGTAHATHGASVATRTTLRKIDPGVVLIGRRTLDCHGDDGFSSQQNEAHAALLLLIFSGSINLLVPDSSELLSITEDDIHVLVKSLEHSHESSTILHSHLHSVPHMVQHLVIL